MGTSIPTLNPVPLKLQVPHVSVLVGSAAPAAGWTLMFMFCVTVSFLGSAMCTEVKAVPVGEIAGPPTVMTLPMPQPGNGSVYGQGELPKPVIVRVCASEPICRCVG